MLDTTSQRLHSPEYALLGLLYEQPCHGYLLHRQLSVELGHIWHLSQSQAYNILKRLEIQGDITSRTLEQEKLPPRRLLQITEKGRTRFDAWLRTPSRGSLRTIRLEFISRLFFTRRYFPGEVTRMIEQEAEDILGVLSRLEEEFNSIPEEQVFNRLSLDLRIQQLQAVKEWMINCHSMLVSSDKLP